jgi:hypothetical protein
MGLLPQITLRLVSINPCFSGHSPRSTLLMINNLKVVPTCQPCFAFSLTGKSVTRRSCGQHPSVRVAFCADNEDC